MVTGLTSFWLLPRLRLARGLCLTGLRACGHLQWRACQDIPAQNSQEVINRQSLIPSARPQGYRDLAVIGLAMQLMPGARQAADLRRGIMFSSATGRAGAGGKQVLCSYLASH